MYAIKQRLEVIFAQLQHRLQHRLQILALNVRVVIVIQVAVLAVTLIPEVVPTLTFGIRAVFVPEIFRQLS